MAFKNGLVAAGLATSEAVRRLDGFSEETFATIYHEKFPVFIQRAGFVGAQVLPDILIAAIPENARGKTAGLIRRLEMQLRGRSEPIDAAVEVYNEPSAIPPAGREALATECDEFHEEAGPREPPLVADGGTLSRTLGAHSVSLSKRDAAVHDIVGSENFCKLTNTEIMKTFRRPLATAVKLKAGDAAKSSLDRIRRAKDYPLSKQITKKRSSHH
jgi:hypothetical protein